MVRCFFSMSLFLCLIAWPACATEIALPGNLVFEVPLEPGWTLYLEPPESLVQEMARHIAHDPSAAGATAEQISSVARNRLAANEGIIYHAASGAHLDIDFSPLDQGETAPDSRMLQHSAEIAAKSLEKEDDVSQLVWDISRATFPGIEQVFLLTAGYLQHDIPMVFLGYVGYTASSWVYLYAQAPGNDPVVLRDMKLMLSQGSVRAVDH